MICIGKISKIDYEAGCADVTIEDRDGIVVTNVPFLDTIYEMPEVRDAVYVDFEERGNRIKRGVILGRFYTKSNAPRQSGKGIFYKKFTDGAYIKYDPDTKTLELAVDNVTIKGLSISENISVTGNATIDGNEFVTGDASIGGKETVTGNVTIGGDETITGSISAATATLGGISMTTHTHTGTHGETSGPH